ncbi:hypothetical protein E5676_scaffold5393G00160 [Cucumis melo var. makuwa]|uniref:DUF4216 domain-containing protein n=1 Tax=Cucumis melo var. makuwa TaxID=1194695 RepID=A0A5D3CVU1_CUCMM|nr:hypothetical protein E6C27_scaffold1276G00220 [Cucumis melo var. makuwa]TYK15368.1 hypothetical protein E5676_scaffold5393G00160 [Cucumis melo var. makuwa]
MEVDRSHVANIWVWTNNLRLGPKQPGYDINTYLAPLIDDLKILWEEGVRCFDAYKEEYFTLRAVLLWTINDFPAYGTLLDIPGESKDEMNSRLDLVEMNIRPELAPMVIDNRTYISATCYTLLREEKYQFYPIGLGSLNSREDKRTDRSLSAGTYVRLDIQQLKQAHLHILQNTKEVMYELHEGKVVSNTIRWLAHGSNCGVMTYKGYMVNGSSYHTKSRDGHRTIQNSGMLVATTMQVSSAKGKNPVIGDMSFYGIIEDIWEVSYNTFNTVLFCIRTDDLYFTLVDLSRIGHSSNSFIIATYGKQVFYVSDPIDSRWSVVVMPPQKDFPLMMTLEICYRTTP